MKHAQLTSLLIGVVALMAGIAYANTSITNAEDWREHTDLYEPCINGDVSSSGLYPSQFGEDKSFATLGILAQQAISTLGTVKH